MTGVSRRAILKSVAKGMVVGRTEKGDQIIVGGGDGGAGPGDQTAHALNGQSMGAMNVSEGKKPASALGALNGRFK